MKDLQNFMHSVLGRAGDIMMADFGKPQDVRRKSNPSNVVTDTDIRVEQFLKDEIGRSFPGDGTIGEEEGLTPGTTGTVWVIDPLDGSSNFVAGLPWFGIMAARVTRGTVTESGILLPVSGEFYYAGKSCGATVNGKPANVTGEKNLSEVLVSYGIDGTEDAKKLDLELAMIGQLAQNSRNLRATNSVYDVCAVATGKTGAYLNRTSRVWDNAAPKLLIEEAGGLFTDFSGRETVIDITTEGIAKNYEFIAAAPGIHRQIMALCNAGEDHGGR